MGANQSSSLTNFTSALSKSITNVVNTTQTDVSSTQKNATTIRSIIGNMDGCSFTVSQSISSTSSIQTMQQATNTSKLSALVSQAVAQAAASSQSAVNGFLSTSFNNQNQSVSNTERLQSIIQQGITNGTFTNVTSFCSNLAQGTFYFGNCKDTQINLTQDVIVQEFTSAVNNAILQSMASSTEITQATQKAIAKQLSENKGVASLVGAVMGAMLGGIVLIVLLVVLVPKLLGGGGGAAGGKGGSAGGLENVIKSNPELLAFRLRSRRIR